MRTVIGEAVPGKRTVGEGRLLTSSSPFFFFFFDLELIELSSTAISSVCEIELNDNLFQRVVVNFKCDHL